MNIETIIDESLWKSIKTNYENRYYSGAILDTIHFLSDLIREKTDLQGDGVNLVGQAFGGRQPKIKITKMQSQSEKDIQKGTEQILRGIYLSIRNPRSHEKYDDEEKDADVIILFVDYLLRIIGKSKTQFSENEFIRKVFDPDFVEKERYAELIVNKIPNKKRLNLLITIFSKKETGNGEKLKYFFETMLSKLNNEESKQFFDIVSEELQVTDSIKSIRLVLQIIPAQYWPEIDEAARLRIENKLINSVKDGRYISTNDTYKYGGLGTWITDIIETSTLKHDLLKILMHKLDSNDITEQDYVFKSLFYVLPDLRDKPPKKLIEIINNGLRSGDIRFYEAIAQLIFFASNNWIEPFKKEYEEFKKSEPSKEKVLDHHLSELDDDEIPF